MSDLTDTLEPEDEGEFEAFLDNLPPGCCPDYYEDEDDGDYVSEYPDDDMWDEDDAWRDDEPSCDNCGPWCGHWGGDGLCMLAIEQEAAMSYEYDVNFVTEKVSCPVCGKPLTQYEIPVDEIWTWPGDFYPPMKAIEIMGILDTPKAIICQYQQTSGDIFHVIIGGSPPVEKLIWCSGAKGQEKFWKITQTSLRYPEDEDIFPIDMPSWRIKLIRLQERIREWFSWNFSVCPQCKRLNLWGKHNDCIPF